MDDQPDQGMRFSQFYIEKGPPEQDSAKFRVRIGGYLYSNLKGDLPRDIFDATPTEMGMNLDYITGYRTSLKKFAERAAHQAILDLVTVVYGVLRSSDSDNANPYSPGRSDQAYRWIIHVNKCLAEENLLFRADDMGGVRYYPDEEFARSKASTLKCLEGSNLAAAAAEYEKAHTHLDTNPPGTKESIRAVFESLEIVFKILTGGGDRDNLGYNGIRDKLLPLINDRYSEDPTAHKASADLTNSFMDWVSAGHMYRHGQDQEEPNDPPLEIAVLMLSSGSAYLRWLAGMIEPADT